MTMYEKTCWKHGRFIYLEIAVFEQNRSNRI